MRRCCILPGDECPLHPGDRIWVQRRDGGPWYGYTVAERQDGCDHRRTGGWVIPVIGDNYGPRDGIGYLHGVPSHPDGALYHLSGGGRLRVVSRVPRQLNLFLTQQGT